MKIKYKPLEKPLELNNFKDLIELKSLLSSLKIISKHLEHIFTAKSTKTQRSPLSAKTVTNGLFHISQLLTVATWLYHLIKNSLQAT